MMDILQTIQSLERLKNLQPATDEQIRQAELALGLKFAPDYLQYVKAYGVIKARGIELTGITHHERLSVVCVTMQERQLNASLPGNMYVIENLAVDGAIALQDQEGKVYLSAPNAAPKCICQSLAEYIEQAK